MNIGIVTLVTLVTLVIVSISLAAYLYFELSRRRKPKLSVYFPGEKNEIQYSNNEEHTVAIHYRNIGRLTVTGLDICVFIPDSFLPSKLEYPGGLTTEVTPASSGSIYKGKQYLYTGRKFVLSYKEEEVLELSTQMPRATGNYPIIIHMVSDQGDAGSYNLNVIIT